MNKNTNIILIGIICFILSFAVSIQLKTIKNTELITYRTSSNTNLRDSTIKWEEKYNEIIENIKEKEKELNDIRTQAVKDNPEALEKEQSLNENNTLLGLTDVQGPGVIITLKDSEYATNKNIGITEDIKNFLVHDANLREIVRVLKTSGAEAISINDQRIVSSTSIICSGNVIRVNDEKVGSPFTIKAIGSPELLYGNLETTIKRLNKSGINVEIEKYENIEINKFNGTIRNEYAKSTE